MIVAFNEVPAKASRDEEAAEVETLTRLLLAAFGAALPSSRVWGSVFQWSDAALTEELRRMVTERGLGLRVAAGDREHGFGREVAAFFAEWVERGGVARVRPLGRRNHDKWFLFERLDFGALRRALPEGAEVVGEVPEVGTALLVSTANLTSADRRKNNAAILIPIDERLAEPLRKRFELLRWLYRLPSVLAPLGELIFKKRFRFTRVEDERFELSLFPAIGEGDPVRRIFESVRADKGPAWVRICNIRWNRTEVAQALLDLYRSAPATTAIEIVARGPEDLFALDEGLFASREMSASVASRLRQCATRYWQRHERDPESGAIRTTAGRDREGNAVEAPVGLASIHGKYWLIEALFGDGEVAERVVWVGSPNMTLAALDSNFEVLLKLKNEPGAYVAFLRNFERLKTASELGGLGATDVGIAPQGPLSSA